MNAEVWGELACLEMCDLAVDSPDLEVVHVFAGYLASLAANAAIHIEIKAEIGHDRHPFLLDSHNVVRYRELSICLKGLSVVEFDLDKLRVVATLTLSRG